jgi:acetyl-CoA carboxylase beta subunit
MNLDVAKQRNISKQNWIKLQAWSLRQIQLHADELLADYEDPDNNQAKMISELKTHADEFTVGDVKKYNERLTDFLQCPLANSEIVLGNNKLDAGNSQIGCVDPVGSY